MKHYVYLISGPTNQFYVGISRNPKVRWKAHQRRPEKTPLYIAMRKFGCEQFEMTVISEHDDAESARKAEIEMIRLLQTQDRNYGFNVSAGGEYDGVAGGERLKHRLATEPEFREVFCLRRREEMKARWASMTLEKRQAIGAAMSKSIQARLRGDPEFAEKKRKHMLAIRTKTNVTPEQRSEQFKKFWIDIRKDPERYAEYMARRAKTVRDKNRLRKSS
jgi:predicted GIY-YIG superfamily endonuclease/predicted Fe-S protein YdhL (DUF1289 family)